MTSLGIRLSGNQSKALKRVKANACTLLACVPKKHASQVAWILFQAVLLFGVGGGEGFLKHSPDKLFLLLEEDMPLLLASTDRCRIEFSCLNFLKDRNDHTNKLSFLLISLWNELTFKLARLFTRGLC